MFKLVLLTLIGAIAFAQIARLSYPPAPEGDQVDDYHGTKISDPHRELENADSPATVKWVDAENALTHSYLSRLPGREAIQNGLTRLWDFERFSGMFKAGDHYFYSRNSGLQNQSVVYTTDELKGTPRVLLDPNILRKDGTAALNGESPSWDGKLFAYAVSQAGSDWSEWRVRDVQTGKDLPDLVQWTKSAVVSWAVDNKGFYYSRFPQPSAEKMLTVSMTDSKVYFHRLGDLQSADKLVYERPDHPDWMFFPEVTEDGNYLVITVDAGDAARNLLYYIDLRSNASKVVELIPSFEFQYEFVGNQGSTLLVKTTQDAPRGRVISINVQHPVRDQWKQVIAEKPETLQSAQLVGGKLLLAYMKDAHSSATLAPLDGKPEQEIAFPGIGTAAWSGARESDQEMFYTFTGYTSPPAIYRLDVTSGKSELLHSSRVDFDSSAYQTTQQFYNSKDGTRVPLFITSRKGIQLDGQNPTLLYGYGGFNIALTPSFSPAMVEWMNMGGIYVVANLRGGSEYGAAWHEAGTKQHKQNVFDDFIAAAEWLIAKRYTSTPKLAIFGGSNGGLLVGAVLNQRPDLFGAAMPAVGVMDMLRFQKFTFGASWVGDYGSSDNPEDFKVLRTYSPLHNIQKGAAYPPTLITTSDHDDRVIPGHSLKYAATLQEAQGGSAPILIRIETRAGHGAGKPTSKTIEEWTDRFVFLQNALSMKAKS